MKGKAALVLAPALLALSAMLAAAQGPGADSAARWAWIPGTVMGVLFGLGGTLVGILAPRGRARGLVMAVHWALFAGCVGLLVVAAAMLVQGRPWPVAYAFGWPALLGAVLLGVLYPVVRHRYQEAEMRRLEARDISHRDG